MIVKVFHNRLLEHPLQDIRLLFRDLLRDESRSSDLILAKSDLLHICNVTTSTSLPLEDAWLATQSLHAPWWENSNVAYFREGRSTMVGDVFQLPNDSYHVVSSIGFRPIKVEESL